MKSISLIRASGAAALVTLLFACSGGTKQNDTTSDSLVMDSMATDTATYEMAHADLAGTKADTTVTGSAHFEKQGEEVIMTLTLTVPKKAGSSVAVHFHEHGDCSNMGEGAHGHWNPTAHNHGKWGSSSYHSGDIGNINLDKDGKATITVASYRWTIGGNLPSNILGHAVIVHSGVDDYTTQPTGNSGSRIGCGVIEHL